MEKHIFKNIKENVSLLGFGLMRLPRLDPNKPEIDYDLATKMIDLAMKQGVTYYDTAFPYHDGLSEVFVGDILSKYPRESYYLASKMPMWYINNLEDAKKTFELQLEKCKTPYFDFYLWHALNKTTFQKGVDMGLFEFLLEKKKEGYIKHIGFSFHDDSYYLEEIAKKYPWEFAQIQLNYLDYEGSYNSKTQYETLLKYNIPAIIMEPVKGGTLATLNENARLIFKEKEKDLSIASWAIRYATSYSNVLVALSGMSDMEQVKDNLNTMNNYKALTEDDYKTIKKATAQYLKSNIVPCTGCEYCLKGCPQKIEIPKIFKIYNSYCTNNDKDTFLKNYVPLLEVADKCIECNKCSKICPQGIKIPKRLVDIKDFYLSLIKE
ncbi:MAG: aldo/keto reductase [Acholeplasmatales bacterium]|jgi:predicted aldo/keto reductase-like oxidoreductase|nr:aldo/keto reductase [Acholeplasmatales bacterium]